MSFNRFQTPMIMRDNLEFAQQIRDQISECRKAFMVVGPLRPILYRNAVDGLENMIYTAMIDKEYERNILDLNAKRKKEVEKLMFEYEKKYKEVSCPDVLEPPNAMISLDHLIAKFQIISNLCSRLNLLLEKEKKDSI